MTNRRGLRSTAKKLNYRKTLRHPKDGVEVKWESNKDIAVSSSSNSKYHHSEVRNRFCLIVKSIWIYINKFQENILRQKEETKRPSYHYYYYISKKLQIRS